MPAATTRADLIAATEKEYAKLVVLCDKLTVPEAELKRADGISIKDTIGHRAHWVGLFLGWYQDGRDGKEVFFPAKGFKWNQLKEYNEILRCQQIELRWRDVRQMLSDNHAALMTFISGHSNIQLYGGPMKGGRNTWTSGRWAEAAGGSHYRSASKFVRACLKEIADQEG